MAPSRVKHIRPVPKTDRIYKLWPGILRSIVDNIRLPGVTMIACVRYGKEEATTIVVMVDSDTRPDTKLTEKGIQSLLDKHHLTKVKIAFEKGRVVRGGASSTGYVDPQVFTRPSMLGQSLSLEGNEQTVGTLGGFVQVMPKGSSGWITMALTCYHVIQPNHGEVSSEVAERWRKLGFGPSDPNRQKLRVHHPGVDTMTETFERITNELEVIQANGGYQEKKRRVDQGCGEMMTASERAVYNEFHEKEQKIQQIKDPYEEFIAKIGSDFGTVWAGSGLRRGIKDSLPYDIDWALIEPHQRRITTNRTPDGKPFSELFPPSADFNFLDLCFFGQRSGYITGIGHGLAFASRDTIKDLATMKEEHTNDYFATSYDPETDDRPQFACLGDSGSFVLTKGPENRKLFGMVIGGNTHGKYTKIALMEDIFSDIKLITGAQDVRLPK